MTLLMPARTTLTCHNPRAAAMRPAYGRARVPRLGVRSARRRCAVRAIRGVGRRGGGRGRSRRGQRLRAGGGRGSQVQAHLVQHVLIAQNAEARAAWQRGGSRLRADYVCCILEM